MILTIENLKFLSDEFLPLGLVSVFLVHFRQNLGTTGTEAPPYLHTSSQLVMLKQILSIIRPVVDWAMVVDSNITLHIVVSKEKYFQWGMFSRVRTNASTSTIFLRASDFATFD